LYFSAPNAGDLVFGITQNSDVDIFNTSGSVMFRADGSTSNVGIGTTSPAKKLEISSGTNGDGILLTGNGSFANGDSRNIEFSYSDTDTSYASAIKFEVKDATIHGGQIGFFTDAGPSSSGSTGTSIRAMTIDPNQNVGIGTDSPLAKLDIQGTQGQLFSVTDDFSGSIFAVSDISGVPIFDVNSSGLSTFDGNVDIKTSFGGSNFYQLGVGTTSSGSIYTEGRIFCNGTSFTEGEAIFNSNVGVGTTSPYKELEVNGTISAGNSNGGVWIREYNSIGQILGINNSGLAYNNLDIRTSSGIGNQLYLNTNGNVGIGTTSPQRKLHVQHSSISPSSVYGTLIVEQSNESSIGILGTTYSSVYFGDAQAPYTGGIVYQHSDNHLEFRTNGNSERMRITSTGNVGIGTTSPSAKLSVIGDINFGGGNNNGIIEVSGSGDLIFKYKGSDPALTLDGGAVKTIVHNRLDALGIVSINNPSNNESILNIQDDGTNGHIAFENSSEITGILSSATDVINFRVGDGVSMSDSPVLTLFSSRIGINTTSPNSNVALDVDGRVLIKDSNGVADFYLGNYATANHFRFHTNNANTYFDMNCGNIYWRDGASTRYTFFPSTANMTVNGTITQNSDARVKENVVEIGDCISKVQAMKGVYYNRTDFNTETKKVGVIAQDVEAVLPELIIESPEDGLKSVAYSELTAVLINAIKEQQEIIEDLKTRITKLEN
jgi:hypothetical protein